VKWGRVEMVYSSLPVDAFSKAELSTSEEENLNNIMVEGMKRRWEGEESHHIKRLFISFLEGV
jgi:hypothetical protein